MNEETFHVPGWGSWIKLTAWVRGAVAQALPGFPRLPWNHFLGGGDRGPSGLSSAIPKAGPLLPSTPNIHSSLQRSRREAPTCPAAPPRKRVLCPGAGGARAPRVPAASGLVPELQWGSRERPGLKYHRLSLFSLNYRCFFILCCMPLHQLRRF